MMEGNLIRRVQPEYPALARMARVQGTVVIHAIVSKDGTIGHLQVISGPPLLVQAAIDAVRQWRYRPYFLNGEPVEVDTQVTVNFTLSGG
jgi:protein TonB